MFVKGFFRDGWVGALSWPGVGSGFVSGVAWVDTTGKSHPVVGGTLVVSHTLVKSGYVGVGVGRSFVAQPLGVSRFDRARPRPGDSDGPGEVFEDLAGGVAFEDASDLSDGLAFG